MAKRKRNLKSIDEAGYELSDSIRAYMAERYPELDPDGTFELFRDKALANDWVYANWDAAFRNYLRRSDEWGGVARKDGLNDPRWRHLLIEARAIGFREPRLPVETVDQYRQALRNWKPPTDLLGDRLGRPVSSILKKVPKE